MRFELKSPRFLSSPGGAFPSSSAPLSSAPSTPFLFSYLIIRASSKPINTVTANSLPFPLFSVGGVCYVNNNNGSSFSSNLKTNINLLTISGLAFNSYHLIQLKHHHLVHFQCHLHFRNHYHGNIPNKPL